MKAARTFGLALCLLAGCQTIKPPAEEAAVARPEEPPVEQEAVPAVPVAPTAPLKADHSAQTAEVMGLLALFQQAVAWPTEEQRRQYGAANQAYAKDRSEAKRLRLATLLALPGAPFQDDTRLGALLDGSASRQESADSPRRQWVTILQKIVAERTRLTNQAQRMEGQLKDEQKRGEELQKKLDALLEIEREMRRRAIR